MIDQIEIWRARIKSMKPGQEMMVSFEEFRATVPTPKQLLFADEYPSPVEKILEGIVGGAFEYGAYEDYCNRGIVFFRLEEPLDPNSGLVTFPAHDRKEYYNYEGRLWRRNNKQYVRKIR